MSFASGTKRLNRTFSLNSCLRVSHDDHSTLLILCVFAYGLWTTNDTVVEGEESNTRCLWTDGEMATLIGNSHEILCEQRVYSFLHLVFCSEVTKSDKKIAPSTAHLYEQTSNLPTPVEDQNADYICILIRSSQFQILFCVRLRTRQIRHCGETLQRCVVWRGECHSNNPTLSFVWRQVVWFAVFVFVWDHWKTGLAAAAAWCGLWRVIK